MYVDKQADLKPPGYAWRHSWSIVSTFSFQEHLKLGLLTHHKTPFLLKKI